ncbi:MAG: MaoC family dehydratase [Bacteroidia bacterium]|nr:MaoC family dehydratase [Bacteroidia bacterium]
MTNIEHQSEKLIINGHKDFEQYVGEVLGTSDYLQITQDQVNKFAEATLDYQWIHTDEIKAKTDSPYGTTIAHGYLSLSVVPFLWAQIIEVKNTKMMVNYGIEKLKFNQPVLVNSHVRVKAKLHSLVNLRGISKVEVKATLEIKGNDKPALDATLIFLYSFND